MDKLIYDFSLYIVTYPIFTLIIIKSPIALRNFRYTEVHKNSLSSELSQIKQGNLE